MTACLKQWRLNNMTATRWRQPQQNNIVGKRSYKLPTRCWMAPGWSYVWPQQSDSVSNKYLADLVDCHMFAWLTHWMIGISPIKQFILQSFVNSFVVWPMLAALLLHAYLPYVRSDDPYIPEPVLMLASCQHRDTLLSWQNQCKAHRMRNSRGLGTKATTSAKHDVECEDQNCSQDTSGA